MSAVAAEFEIACSDGTAHTRKAPSGRVILSYVQGIACRPHDKSGDKTWEIREIPAIATGVRELLFVVTRKGKTVYTRMVNE